MASMADRDNMHYGYAIGPLFYFDCFGHLDISKVLHMISFGSSLELASWIAGIGRIIPYDFYKLWSTCSANIC